MAIRIFQHYWQPPLAALAGLEALIFFGAPYSVLSWSGTVVGATSQGRTGYACLFAAIMFLTNAAVGLYHARQRFKFIGLFARVTASFAAGTLVLFALAHALPELVNASNGLLASTLVAYAGSLAVRVAFDRVVDENIFKRRVLVYGAGARAASITQLRRRSDRRGFVVVAYVRTAYDDPAAAPAGLTIGNDIDSLLRICEEHRIDEIVVAMDERRRGFPMDQLLECRLDGIEITELVTFFERETGKLRLDLLNPSWMIFSDGFRRGRIHSVLERALDVLASLALLAVAWPIMLLTVVAIKLEEGFSAPVFYRQLRVGQHGKTFPLLKFRSMRPDAEGDGKAQWAQKNDSRVTRVGRCIRKTRIDEIPQILNVLRGHMSFVGPRPERPEFVADLNERIPYYRERHTIKPGITGWAQLCYPYGSSEQDSVEKLQYDLFYVKNHSLLFYLAILVQTVEVIVWGKGAR